MKSNLIYILFFQSLLTSNLAWSHGDDKLGPHGGFIQMPGAFHTEIALQGANKLKVFLLDMDWKNPTILDSSLNISYQGTGAAVAKCLDQKDHFLCNFPKAIDLKKNGQLTVESKREGMRGNKVVYDLPLKLKPMDHGM